LPFSEAFLWVMIILVAASPCALAIATPAAILEKTGTITSGEFQITDLSAYGESGEEELLSTAAALEAGSNHPLAAAVQRFVDARGTVVERAQEVEAVGGKGVTGSVDGKAVRIGNRKLFAEGSIPETIEQSVQAYQREGKTCMMVQREFALLWVLAL